MIYMKNNHKKKPNLEISLKIKMNIKIVRFLIFISKIRYMMIIYMTMILQVFRTIKIKMYDKLHKMIKNRMYIKLLRKIITILMK